ncbi:transaldolase [Campylobacter sp. 19-13652]|uniref:transaldolase n=1 Tax=Campylobacter sp. 19-13652 TaxID=2840180 RepID=UPI001C7475D6|nr:transaldolase [Campylobacter sp. 19-13652]BCX78812.1 transaldolase [Campylobacter sp. 19-13652]
MGKFSLWCDFIERDFVAGEFLDMVRNGDVNGATSNPAIFNSAFKSSAYKLQADKMTDKSEKQKYETLACEDIKAAARALILNYENGDDGFVSIEVDPNLSNDTAATVAEGKRLYAQIAMPNVMIKVPATQAGYEAMSELIASGISVNATLIFSPDQAASCAAAFRAGSDKFKAANPDKPLPQGVISIFVSRFDRLLDECLAKQGLKTSKFGIANASKIYKQIIAQNLPNVRALFASTGVKGGELSPSYYVSELMYENAINTAPLETIKAFLASNSSIKEPMSDTEIELAFESVRLAGFELKSVYDRLLSEGLEAFEKAFADMLAALK